MSDLYERTLCFANRHTAPELPENVRESNANRITNLVVELLRLSNIARKEGLLAMEEYAEGYVIEREPENIFFKKAIHLVVDGMEPEYVRNILGANILVSGVNSFQGYLKFLCMEGILSIQAGENPRIIEEKLLACISQNMQIRVKQAIEEMRNKMEQRSLREEFLHIATYNSSEARALFLSVLEEKFLHLTEEQLICVMGKIDTEQLGALIPKVREEVRALLFRYLTKEQIQDMLVDTFQWHKMSLAEALAGITELFQQLEKNGEI